VDAEIDRLLADIDRIANDLFWARGQVIADDPTRLQDGGARLVKDLVNDWLQATRNELLIESAYFVMLDRSVAGLAGAVDRGIKVRVLTNSLASNDVAAAHAGYEKSRSKLLRAGVEIYELRPDAGQNQEWSIVGGRSIAALHTKAMVIDRQSTFVGSYNLDPRSGNINTEIGLIVDGAELAARVAEFMDQGVVPGNAYRVALDEQGKLQWTTRVGESNAVFRTEPETSVWKRFSADLIKALPVEEQL
jgi:putative cardiolipin synthase